MESPRQMLPVEWIGPFWMGLQILLILVVAFVLQRLVARCLKRLE